MELCSFDTFTHIQYRIYTMKYTQHMAYTQCVIADTKLGAFVMSGDTASTYLLPAIVRA